MSILDHENLLVFITRGVLLFSALVVLTTFFYGQTWQISGNIDAFLGQNVAAISQAPILQNVLAETIDENQIPATPKPAPTINAAATVSVEVKHGNAYVLLNQRAQEPMPIASLTKLMTALVVLETYDLHQVVTIDESIMKQEGEQGILKMGEQVSVENLLYLSLIESSNRAAFALANVMGPELFITRMNQTAKRLGLVNTRFTDSTGLSPESYSTAQDLVSLTRYLFEHYPLFDRIISQKTYDLYLPNGQFHHRLENTNKLLGEIPSIIGGKTGYTTLAKGCVMVIQKNNTNQSYFIHLVLGADDRFLEMKKIIDWINLP